MAKGIRRYMVITNGVQLPDMMTLADIRKKVKDDPEWLVDKRVFTVEADGSLTRMQAEYTVSFKQYELSNIPGDDNKPCQ